MITIPEIRGVPTILQRGAVDPVAAKCVLSIAAPGPVERPRRRGMRVEHAVLLHQLNSWMADATRNLTIFKPHVFVNLTQAPRCACCADAAYPMSAWIGNQNQDTWDTRWRLDRRWPEIERAEKGLAPTAIAVLEEAGGLGIPVYTPRHCLWLASNTWWYGETDEKYALEEYFGMVDSEEGKVKEEDIPIPRRAWLDKILPIEASEASRKVSRPALERLANRRSGLVMEIARKVLALDAEIRGHRSDRKFVLHTEQDEMYCLGYGATVRWNARDPMARVFDDHANNLHEAYHVEPPYGWFPLKGPQDLRALMAHLEERFAVAHRQEQLLSLIAERSSE